MREDMYSPPDGLMTPRLRQDALARLGRTAATAPLLRFADHVRAYTARQLMDYSDELNAFEGLRKALSPSMNYTKTWFGMPAFAFDWALLWKPSSSGTDRRGFPSWSWAGWNGEVSMAYHDKKQSEQIQSWLRKRTWIKWHICDKDGKIMPVWNGRPNNVSQAGKLIPIPFISVVAIGKV